MADWEKKIEDERFSGEEQLEKANTEAWDLFYKRNSKDNIFKHRHWPVKEFLELKACKQVVGCLLNKWFQENLYIHIVRLQNTN